MLGVGKCFRAPKFNGTRIKERLITLLFTHNVKFY
jgi:hypothetical protein